MKYLSDIMICKYFSMPIVLRLFIKLVKSFSGSIADLRTGGCWFDLRLSQYSIQGLIIIIVIGIIPLSLLSIAPTMVM